MYYIQEADKPPILFKLFNIVQLQGNKMILPIDAKQKITTKKAQKLAKKTMKILEKAKSRKVIISKKMQEQEEYGSQLYTYNLDIVEGRWLFELLSCMVLDYILEKKKQKKEETKITILVNDLSENMLANLKIMTKEYKMVNIITNHREKFKKLEKQLLEEEGTMITIGNNKKKGLSKAEIILNVDFPSELINQYNIKEDAIIVNIRGNVKITQKRFNGISINNYEIIVEKEGEFDYDKMTKYETGKVYEAKMNKRQPFEDLMKQIQKDNVKIAQLVGMNTII